MSLEKSPYLLQHAANPVDWFPWGDEAFRVARERDCPIFLSIGYATCHWCHVMEHESFEDEGVAALMDRALVSVKVDREERPDVDEQYMTVCTLLTGSGGWPLTIVMTPGGIPFFAATYIPRQSMLDLIPQIGKVWAERRADVLESAGTVLEALRKSVARGDGGELPGREVLDRGFSELRAEFDEEHGGFGSAPKFPTPHNLFFLLRYHGRTGDPEALRMVERTLTAMRRGGVYDQVGFGFHRYSTDERWLVPHFEKMLYDQALLAMACAEAFQATGGELYARTVRETLAYVERDLLLPEGAFASAEDADSEGEEGRFYLWSHEELRAALSPQELRELERACAVAPGGNYTDPFGNGGGNILHLAHADARIEEAVRARLFDRRARRPRPLRDDKILADWNGLAIAAFARASRALGDPRLAVVASRAAAFLQGTLRAKDGRLLHRYRDGEAGIPGFAADYAFLAWGLTELYEATLESRHLAAALELCSSLLDLFVDRDERGGARLSMTARDGEALLVRPGSASDGALPSAVSVTVLVLLRLARMTGRVQLEDAATALVRSLAPELSRQPRAFTFLLGALDFLHGPTQEIVITGTPGALETETMLDVVRGFLPRAVLLFRDAGSGEELGKLAPYTRALRGVEGRATAYVCRGRSCDLPTTDPKELARLVSA